MSKCPGCEDCTVETLYQRKERALAAIELSESKRPLSLVGMNVVALAVRTLKVKSRQTDEDFKAYNRLRVAAWRKKRKEEAAQ